MGQPSKTVVYHQVDLKVVMRRLKKFCCLFMLLSAAPAAAVGPMDAAAADRPQATWPPTEARLRLVIDTDAANEVDDQYALALALGFPERLQLEGIVAAHYGPSGGAKGIEKSYAEIQAILEKAGMRGKFPVKRGVPPFESPQTVPTSEGIKFIIEQAMAATPEEPLWLVALGPATNAMAAMLTEPKITDRIVVFWHGRSEWPDWCRNFNARNDAEATQLLFSFPSQLILFDTGAQLTIPLEESGRRIAPHGALGAYLHQIRRRNPHWLAAGKGMYDLGDIAALIDPNIAKWERIAGPAVTDDLRFDFSTNYGPIIRIYNVDRDVALDLLERALQRIAQIAND
jgi:purine nucleosidase